MWWAAFVPSRWSLRFVGVTTLALAISSLVVRDFQAPYFKPTPDREFRAARVMSLFIGFIPLIFVFFAPGLLHLSFFTRAPAVDFDRCRGRLLSAVLQQQPRRNFGIAGSRDNNDGLVSRRRSLRRR